MNSHDRSPADEFTPPLPGLGTDPADTRGRVVPPLVTAVRRTLARLDELNLLDDRHAATMQLALDLADQLGVASVARRATSAAMIARELRETLALLPVPVEDAANDDWNAFTAAFREAASRDAAQPVPAD